jgi:hypothetical protein
MMATTCMSTNHTCKKMMVDGSKKSSHITRRILMMTNKVIGKRIEGLNKIGMVSMMKNIYIQSLC